MLDRIVGENDDCSVTGRSSVEVGSNREVVSTSTELTPLSDIVTSMELTDAVEDGTSKREVDIGSSRSSEVLLKLELSTTTDVDIACSIDSVDSDGTTNGEGWEVT